jgi:hypothetical protein
MNYVIWFAGGFSVGSIVFWFGFWAGRRSAAMYFDDHRNEFLYFDRRSLGVEKKR